MHQDHIKRCSARRLRAGAVLGRVAVCGGLVVAGLAFGVLLGLPSAGPARAGDQNYVRTASHEAIGGVRLDEEYTITFNTALYEPSVGPDTIVMRTGSSKGEQPRGDFVLGRFLFDQNTRRRVVIRPEAVREYYQLVKGYSRTDAERAASRAISRVESTGNRRTLNKIDKALVGFFGATYGAGTRLDDDGDVNGDGVDDRLAVVGTYPAVQAPGSSLQPYRERIAGDDAKWQDYYVNGNFDAFVDLQNNPEYERFFHPVDPATGIADDESVLRGREYRQVLVDRRSKARVMFVPEVPIRADLTDTGYKPGSSYTVIVPAWQQGVFNTVLTARGKRPLLQADGRDYSTYYNTIPGTSTSSNLFLDGESRKFQSELQKPRVVNITPPNGETFVDPTTDWEDPDNQALVPVSARKTFTVRLRFAQALDPRTVTPSFFTITQTKQNVGSTSEKVVSIPIAAGTFLNQHRLGKVEVEITPATNLEGGGEFEVSVNNLVKSLGGKQLNESGAAYKVTFVTGAAEPPLDAIREDFARSTNQADPNDPDTLDQVTTAYWPAPATFDAGGTGRLVMKFMPWAGTGVGAPSDPRDANSPIVESLNLTTGDTIIFATSVTDPASPNFGNQIEYNYKNVDVKAATMSSQGTHPLIIRSQNDVLLNGAFVLVNGQDGANGRTNSDTVNGDPTGGLGGAAGPGGYRGGDGAGAPLTDSNNQVVLSATGRLQFDQAKFAGTDGAPGFLVGGSPGGGGAGGFSGDREFPPYDANNSGTTTNEDYPLIRERAREAGGGGGHATAGQNGSGTSLTQEQHTDGYFGGLGGSAYGDNLFSTAPINSAGVPTLSFGFGGAGGGGGGLEDDSPTSTDGDGLVGPEDSGGGGGGGGGGAIQITARRQVFVFGTTIDASGGRGGRTWNVSNSATGQGAAGGCGAGGSIWLQAYEDDVIIDNGSFVTVLGGPNDTLPSVGQVTTSVNDTPSNDRPQEGNGGAGGEGWVRIEDKDGVVLNLGTQINNTLTPFGLSIGTFRPEADGSYPGRGPEVPMVVESSVAYSKWFNSQLDTPTYIAVFDDPATPTIEGTQIFEYVDESGGQIQVDVRTAPNDPANSGHPSTQPTAWTPLSQVTSISDRRFLQFRITLSLPLNYDFSNPLPYVDFLRINIETQ